MKLVILDYENSQVRIINNCPTNWNSENIEDLEDYMFDGEHLNLNPDMCYYMHDNGIEVVNETYTPKRKNMPSKVDFSSRKEKLHEEMLQCIKKLMLSASQTILDLTQNENGEDTSYSAYIIRSLDVCEDVEEVEVMQIKLEMILCGIWLKVRKSLMKIGKICLMMSFQAILICFTMRFMPKSRKK